MNSAQEPFDDAKRDEPADVDAERDNVVCLLPLVDRQTGPELGVEVAKGSPLDVVSVGLRKEGRGVDRKRVSASNVALEQLRSEVETYHLVCSTRHTRR